MEDSIDSISIAGEGSSVARLVPVVVQVGVSTGNGSGMAGGDACGMGYWVLISLYQGGIHGACGLYMLVVVGVNKNTYDTT